MDWTRLFGSLVLLVGPQILGIIVAEWPGGLPRRARLALAVVLPPAVFAGAGQAILAAEVARVHATGGYFCGTAVGVVCWALTVGTGAQLAGSVFMQIGLSFWRRWRSREARS